MDKTLNLKLNYSEQKDGSEIKDKEIISPTCPTPKNENPSLKILKQHKQIQTLMQELTEEKKKVACLIEKQNLKDLLFYQFFAKLNQLSENMANIFLDCKLEKKIIDNFLEVKQNFNELSYYIIHVLQENNKNLNEKNRAIENEQNKINDLQKRTEELFGVAPVFVLKEIEIVNTKDKMIGEILMEKNQKAKEIERLNGCILEKNEKINKLEQATKNLESKLLNQENELNQQKNQIKGLIDNINLKKAETNELTVCLQESQEKSSKLENEKNKLDTKLSEITLLMNKFDNNQRILEEKDLEKSKVISKLEKNSIALEKEIISLREELQCLKTVLLEKDLTIEKLNSQINSDFNLEEKGLQLSFRKFDNILSKEKNRKEEDFDDYLRYSSRLESEKKLKSLSKTASNSKSNANFVKKLFN